MFVVMQGDEYGIPIQIKTSEGIATANTFLDVEIVVGDMRKTLADGEITYSETEQAFIYPITQEESLGFSNMKQRVQLRCKFPNGEVVGVSLGDITVRKSASKAVL